MRLWHYELLPYLPAYQLKGQYRELIAIMRNWRDKGTPNHLLVNPLMDYPKTEFMRYFSLYCWYYSFRFGKQVPDSYKIEFVDFCYSENKDNIEHTTFPGELFKGWHNKEYLRVCMANLYEKYKFAKGKSKISEIEWKNLLRGYKTITHEEYVV